MNNKKKSNIPNTNGCENETYNTNNTEYANQNTNNIEKTNRNTINTEKTSNTDNPNGATHINGTESTKGNSQRIVALVGVILLAVVIIALLLTAIFDPTGVWFRACLVLAIALPILLWIYVWLYGMLRQRKTMASFDFLEDNEKEN